MSSPEARMPVPELAIEMTTPDHRDLPVFIAGNFNDWQAADERYRMRCTGPGSYTLRIPGREQLPEVLEYKYTRGSWEEVELDRYGNAPPNRRLVPGQALVCDEVVFWRRNGLSYHPGFLPQIQVISEAFEMPQLIKTRRVAALLPHDYDQTDRRYPVLYLQDGQNLFDDYAPFGNWAVDKKLAVMAEQGFGDVIIISIDHAAEERIAEYTPSTQTRLGSGQGKKYVRFLADTLKPYVDRHFRTLPDRAHTGIGGSSLGGLISIYAGLTYPEVYSKLMIFSPSLWVAPNIHFHAMNLHDLPEMKIYLYGGVAESANMVPNIHRFRDAVRQQQPEADIAFEVVIDPAGAHNEERWGQEFPRAVEWLFSAPPPSPHT